MVAAFLHRFDEVGDRRITTREVDALRFDRTIQHWEHVFARARQLLAGLFPDVHIGDAAGSALLFNMEKLFETVLEVASGRKPKSEQHGVGEEEFAPWSIGPTL